MRILVISDKIFTRGLGDGLRVYGLLKPLVGRYRFDLICFARPQKIRIQRIYLPGITRGWLSRQYNFQFVANDYFNCFTGIALA